MPKATRNVLGAWAFLIGVILAVLIGLFGLTNSPWPLILMVLGIVIGLLNIGGSELKEFMLAGAVLVIVSKFGRESVSGSLIGLGLGDVVSSIFGALLILFIPATIIVALKTVFSIAKV